MFEMSESDNTLLFTMVQVISFVDWCKFRKWSSQKNGVIL